MRIARSIAVGCTAVLALSELTGCGAGAIGGLGAVALLAATLAAACGGHALTNEEESEPDAAAGGASGTGGASAAGGSAQDSGAGGSAPDAQLVDQVVVDSSPVDVELPDAAACPGKCPSGMMCVLQANGPWCVPDADRDEITDQQDNCPYAANPGQADADGDKVGDACDLCVGPNETSSCGLECCNDPDGDGIAGTSVWGSTSADKDNCPYIPNPGQEDADHDGIGDACDLCKYDPNPLSPCGDPCLDSDGDGVSDQGYCGAGDTDTCRFTPSDQFDDADKDNVGDVCDPDGIAPLAMRMRILERLARDGILDAETAAIAIAA